MDIQNKLLKTIFTAVICFYFWHYLATYTDWHLALDDADLIFHEAGHVFAYPFGEFIYVCGGSFFQVAFPSFFSFYFYVTGQKVSGSLCLLWVGASLLNVSLYAGDAIVRVLPLLGGDNSFHDWNYILTSLHALQNTYKVAHTLYGLGATSIVVGSLLALYFCVDPTNSGIPKYSEENAE